MSQSNTDKNQLVLGYWAIRGLVEPIRLILQYTKTPYTDKLYVQGEGPEFSREEWLSEKEKIGLDFPNLPYLFDGDLKIIQSKAILYYLGGKLNLMGKTPKEQALVMMLCEQAHDLRMKTNEVFYSPKGKSKEERTKFVQNVLSQDLKQFDDFLGKSKSKFAVGDQPTVADFQLFEYIDAALALDDGHTLLEKYANLQRLLKAVRELSEVQGYIAKAHSQVPLNNKIASYGGTVLGQK